MWRKPVLAILLTVGLLVSPAMAALTDAIISAPIEMPAMQDETVTFPLMLTGTGTLAGGEIQINYDSDVLELANVTNMISTDVTPGELISGWTVMASVPYGQGTTYVTTNGTVWPENPSGTYLNVSFHVLPDAPTGVTDVELVDFQERGWCTQNGSLSISVPEPSSLFLLLCLFTAGPVLLMRHRHISR